MSIVKHFVSKKKRRFQQNGYDLDLTYITDNIVAMGYPSEKLEGMFRNKADDVIRFFDQYHSDSYKIYNLCSERKYDPSKFHNRVAEYPFEDHNAPRFEMLKPCCEDIYDWLKGNSERNVVAIHCKAGKGRTGVIICSYLLHIQAFSSTKEALQFYGERRTQNAKGVTIPSQRRYVYYYSYMLRKNLIYSPTPLLLKSITLMGIPTYSSGVCAPMFIVRQGQGAKIYQSEVVQDVKKTDREIKIVLPKPLPICGDMRIEFVHVGKISNREEKMFQYWFNTFFIYHSCPTEEQELGASHPLPPTIPEHPEKEANKPAKKPAQTQGAGIDSASSLPIQKSTSSGSLGEAELRASPERNLGIGLTKKKRGSVRRSISELPADGMHPFYCEEFHLNLPKWELDRAHKDKECKQYPDSFRVITSMDNPMSQDPEDFDKEFSCANKRDELVDSDTDLDEDNDDDDVRDPSEMMKLTDKKDRQIGANVSDKPEHKRKAHGKGGKISSTVGIGNSSRAHEAYEGENISQRVHSNAITSFSPLGEAINDQFQPLNNQIQPTAEPTESPNYPTYPPNNPTPPPNYPSSPPNYPTSPPNNQTPQTKQSPISTRHNPSPTTTAPKSEVFNSKGPKEVSL